MPSNLTNHTPYSSSYYPSCRSLDLATMIKYNSGSFGFGSLFRLHGSAVGRSLLPGVISSLLYLLLFHVTDLVDREEPLFDHPYPIGALISALTFLLAFR
jgi:hypothetical protein